MILTMAARYGHEDNWRMERETSFVEKKHTEHKPTLEEAGSTLTTVKSYLRYKKEVYIQGQCGSNQDTIHVFYACLMLGHLMQNPAVRVAA